MSAIEHAALVERARRGDKAALLALVEIAQQLSYRLAVRMVPDRAEAQDLTQEILIRVVTGLDRFRGESAFQTWVYRVASNHLLTARKRMLEHHIESLEAMAEKLAEGMADALASADAPLEDQLLVREAKLTCTGRMLVGLDREHRLAFILGEILELSSEEGAEVLEIEPATFRKRLSRARERMQTFVEKTCGVVDPKNPCRCALQGARMTRVGHFDATLPWTNHPVCRGGAEQLEGLEGIGRSLQLFRSHPDYAAPAALANELRRMIDADTTGLLK
ncbi:MAG: sigma-70 family RNA polymerase sigma factor [Myxococcota bacterium]